MKELVIIRGLPGSGKTRFAQILTQFYYEADMYFTAPNGEYHFNRELLPEAHAWCKAKVTDAMIAGVPCIAVSNTFVRKWEKIAYLNLADVYGYTVTEVTMSGPLRLNVHGVPEEVIERMKAQWDT